MFPKIMFKILFASYKIVTFLFFTLYSDFCATVKENFVYMFFFSFFLKIFLSFITDIFHLLRAIKKI